MIISNSSLTFPIFLDEISEKYIIDNPDQIAEFLYKNQELLSVILQAEKQIKKYFYNDKISLKMITDPEITNWEILSIIIQTKLEANQAFDKLKQLDHDWWLDIFSQVDKKLNIYIDFDEI